MEKITHFTAHDLHGFRRRQHFIAVSFMRQEYKHITNMNYHGILLEGIMQACLIKDSFPRLDNANNIFQRFAMKTINLNQFQIFPGFKRTTL